MKMPLKINKELNGDVMDARRAQAELTDAYCTAWCDSRADYDHA